MLDQLKRRVPSARRRRNRHSFAAQIERLEDRRLLSASPSPTALTPAEIRAYYGFNDINFTYYATIKLPSGGIDIHRVTVPGDGTGQTIAIIDKYYDPNIVNDVNVFDSQFNLPAIHLTVDQLPTATTTDPTGSWENEESLDVEWAHAIAPGANILVVNCGTSEADVLSAVNTAKNYAGVSVVSMSLAGDEFAGELADDSYFTNPSNHGGVNVSFVASSGDDFPANPPGPLYPSSSPNVLAVGGTVLKLSSSGDTEVSWQDSEGGESLYELEPRYQEFVQQTGFRTTPDVSYAATNFAAYNSFPYLDMTTNKDITLDWHTPQGTSLGAPQWAALIAIANQGRVLGGQSTLNDLPGEIYALPSTDFNDITTGPANREGYSPTVGYDEITGRGSPKANLIVQSLLNPPVVVFPPYMTPLAVSAGNVTGPSSTPQGAQDTAFLGSSLPSVQDGALAESAGYATVSISPLAVVSSEPTLGNLSGAPLTSAGSGSDGTTSRSPMATQSALVSGRSSLPHSGAVAVAALGDGLSPDSNTALNNTEGIQWAGLNAALDVLST